MSNEECQTILVNKESLLTMCEAFSHEMLLSVLRESLTPQQIKNGLDVAEQAVLSRQPEQDHPALQNAMKKVISQAKREALIQLKLDK